MRKTTKRGAVLSAVAVVTVMVWLVLGLAFLWRQSSGEGLGPLLALYILLYLAVAVGAVAALVQRLREIDRG